MLRLATLTMTITTYILINSKNSCNGERTNISLTVDRSKGPAYHLPCATIHGKGRVISPHLGFYEHFYTYQDTGWGPSIPLTSFTRFLHRSSQVMYSNFTANFTVSFHRGETDFDLSITKRSACLAGTYSFFETNQDSAYGTGDRELVSSTPDFDDLDYSKPDVVFGLVSYIKETVKNTESLLQNLSTLLENRKDIHTSMNLLRNRIIPDVCERGYPGFTNLTLVRVPDGRDVLCDTVSDGGGWILFQRRVNGVEDFDRDWDDYKKGFGTLNGDFWMGNDWLTEMTNTNVHNTSWEIMVDARYKGKRLWSIDYPFSIAGENKNYTLHVGHTVGGNNSAFHYPQLEYKINGFMFSTRDRDNDDYYYHCARQRGGFWFRKCAALIPNGLWGSKSFGIAWYSYTGFDDTLDSIEMKIRRVYRPTPAEFRD